MREKIRKFQNKEKVQNNTSYKHQFLGTSAPQQKKVEFLSNQEYPDLNYMGDTTYKFSFMERDPGCIPYKQPTAKKPHLPQPKTAFMTVSDYK
jgi:hypothetical protein